MCNIIHLDKEMIILTTRFMQLSHINRDSNISRSLNICIIIYVIKICTECVDHPDNFFWYILINKNEASKHVERL